MKVDFEAAISCARAGEPDDAGVAELAQQLAASGERLSQLGPRTADLASTGGPTSLSTLWAPAVLASKGWLVPKLGVPGRPAGGIDVLAQIPGYRTDLSAAEARAVLEQCGYVHVQAGNVFAPADAAFFRFRQNNDAQAIPVLAIASLLAKKLAMGVNRIGLEVRVAPHGNFGATIDEARGNARRFCKVAALLGLQAVCILTDGSRPYQPFLGRGEALLALSMLFSGRGSEWLKRHARSCETWASATVESPLRPAYAPGVAHAFAANVVAQGGNVDGMEEVAFRTASGHHHVIPAPHDGTLRFDLGRLRDAIGRARAVSDDSGRFPDDVGVVLLVEPDHTVRDGEPVMTARCHNDVWPTFELDLKASIRMADTPVTIIADWKSGGLELVRV